MAGQAGLCGLTVRAAWGLWRLSINSTVASPLTHLVCSKEVWTARLQDFLHDCAASAPSQEHDRIREAWLLFVHEPGLRDGQATRWADLNSSGIEAMLACGAAESAVLALIGPDDTFMLSRGVNGTCLATLVMPDGSEEMIEAATLSLALLAAYVSKLLTGIERRNQEKGVVALPSGGRLH
ncbi:MAG: hypothetical protein K0R64_2228 [Novosphingobium lindaniclasticum]|jgi:hypothetical protein|nr:hypothetical protein [Novosphingobium lindaniclasticum]